jgi:hypothetical protein
VSPNLCFVLLHFRCVVGHHVLHAVFARGSAPLDSTLEPLGLCLVELTGPLHRLIALFETFVKVLLRAVTITTLHPFMHNKKNNVIIRIGVAGKIVIIQTKLLLKQRVNTFAMHK